MNRAPPFCEFQKNNPLVWEAVPSAHLKTFWAILLMLCCATRANTALRSSLKPRADARATPYPTWSYQRRFSRILFEKRVNLVKTHQRCSNNSGGSCLRGGRVKLGSSSRVQVVDCMAQEKWNTGVENLDMERDGQRDILRVNWAVCDFKAVMRQRGFDDNVMNLSSNEKTSC